MKINHKLVGCEFNISLQFEVVIPMKSTKNNFIKRTLQLSNYKKRKKERKKKLICFGNNIIYLLMVILLVCIIISPSFPNHCL